jgi:hypothetical protein
LVITNPAEYWLRFPYAIEHAWVTENLTENLLYLHCIVPAAQKAQVRGLVRECERAGWCKNVMLSWSTTSWQELAGAGVERGPEPGVVRCDAVLREYPLVVPVLFESWAHPENLAGVWSGISEHIGGRLRQYVPHGRIYGANGKLHVRQAYDLLNEHGLFRQYVVRYEGWVTGSLEVFIVLRHASEWLAELREALRPSVAAMESFTGNDGSTVVRAVGQHDLLLAVFGLLDDLRSHGARCYLRNPRANTKAPVRFCYELLFDPTLGAWVFPHDELLDYMRGAA